MFCVIPACLRKQAHAGIQSIKQKPPSRAALSGLDYCKYLC